MGARQPALRLTVAQPPDPLESIHQKNLFYTAALHEKQWPDLTWLMHVPNGEYRPDGTGSKLKAQGVRPGVEDCFMDVPRRDPETGGVFLGWRGELKRYSNGKPSLEQEDWMAFHRSQGYYADWHKGYEAMWENLLWYLNLPRICPAPAPRPVRIKGLKLL